MMGRTMVMSVLGSDYSKSCDQSPGLGLSLTLIQVLAISNWKTSTASAAAKPTPERILKSVAWASTSSSSSCIWKVPICDGVDGKEVPSGWVGA